MEERIELPALVRLYWKRLKLYKKSSEDSGADPGFLEKEFVCIKVCVCVEGVRYVDFISFFLNIPWK